MSGRVIVLIGGFLLGVAIPFDVWDWLRKMAKDPTVTEYVFFVLAFVVLAFVVLVIYKNVKE